MEDDSYKGIFDDATVEDFMRSTSARIEVTVRNEGREAFDAFVAEQLRAVRTAWLAAETWMQPIVVLASRDRQRVFTADEDETLQQFVHRMHREAFAMEAQWVFLAKRTMVADIDKIVDLAANVDVSDPHAWAKAEAAGLTRLGVLWYAERHEGPEEHFRHGQFQDENGVLSEPHEGPTTQRIPLFEEILGEINS